MATITISRGTSSGGEILARYLSKRLGYALISREVMLRAATEYGVSEEKLITAIEEGPSLKERLAMDTDRSRYLSFIQAALCEEAKNDNLIYHGLGGHVLLSGISHVVKVKVIADMEQRIRFAMERHGFIREEAIAYIRKMDKYRKRWTRFLYDVHWNAPHLYDIVINLNHITILTACNIISAMAQAEEFRTTEASIRAMENLELASRIKATLASNDSTKCLDVKVQADNGFITLSGRVHTKKHIENLKKVVRSIEGVRGLNCTCHPFYFELDREDLLTLSHLK